MGLGFSDRVMFEGLGGYFDYGGVQDDRTDNSRRLHDYFQFDFDSTFSFLPRLGLKRIVRY